MSRAAIDEKPRIALADAERLAAEVVDLLDPVCERIEIAGSIRRRVEMVGDIEIVVMPRPYEVNGRFSGPYDLRGLFSEQVSWTPDGLTPRVDILLSRGRLEKRLDVKGRPRYGPKLKYLRYRGVGVDLFSVFPPACAKCGVIREGAPPQRDEGGEPDRESTARNSRPAQGHSDLPILSSGVSDSLTACPQGGQCVPRPGRPQWGVIFTIRTGSADYSHQLVTPQGQSFRDFKDYRRAGLLPPHLRVDKGTLWDGPMPVYTPEEADFFRAIEVPYLPPEQRR